jgi:hypothetical protein
VVRGEWSQGVIVFPSGDVVVRMDSVFNHVDTTIEAIFLSSADAVEQFTPWRCGKRRYLRLRYLAANARASVISICETDLRESAVTIASYINSVKSKSISSGLL